MNKALLAVTTVVILGGAVFLWMAQQSVPQTAGPATQASDAGAPVAGAAIATVAVPANLSAEAQMGQRGFEAKCASCHGLNAAGQDGVAPPLVHKVYEPGHHSDMAFVMAARNGVRAHHWKFGNMPAVEGLTDADVMMIARYIRELQQENGIF